MILTTFTIALTIAGLSLLWRNFRYDTDNPLYPFFEKLPYGIRKPITCGLCVTYWITCLILFVYNPLYATILPLLAHTPTLIQYVGAFIGTWMITGTVAVCIVYTVDTLYQISHFFAHKAHEPHHSQTPDAD
jgi:hypothetical protein